MQLFFFCGVWAQRARRTRPKGRATRHTTTQAPRPRGEPQDPGPPKWAKRTAGPATVQVSAPGSIRGDRRSPPQTRRASGSPQLKQITASWGVAQGGPVIPPSTREASGASASPGKAPKPRPYPKVRDEVPAVVGPDAPPPQRVTLPRGEGPRGYARRPGDPCSAQNCMEAAGVFLVLHRSLFLICF